MDQKLLHNISQKKFFWCLKTHHFRAISPKWVLSPQREISCHIFKMAILTKFFDDLMNHITREYAGKKVEIFLNVSLFTIAHLLLWPFKVASLYCNDVYAKNKNQQSWFLLQRINIPTHFFRNSWKKDWTHIRWDASLLNIT